MKFPRKTMKNKTTGKKCRQNKTWHKNDKKIENNKFENNE